MRVDDAEMMRLFAQLESLGTKVPKLEKKELEKAAAVYLKALQVLAPKAAKDVMRYDTPKGIGRLRAPKGKGVVVATYTPGNLGRSFQALKLRKLKGAVLIGPKVAKGKGAKGRFVGRRVDGYYATFVEGRKPFVGAIWSRSRQMVLFNIRKLLRQRIEAHIKK